VKFLDKCRPASAPVRRGNHAKARPPSLVFFFLLSTFLRRCLLGGREALGLFATRCAFPYIISALAISHKTSNLTFLQPIPNDFAEPRENDPALLPRRGFVRIIA
jgi:hypothetical protein